MKKHRHSCESRNPWIPAFAGMTVRAGMAGKVFALMTALVMLCSVFTFAADPEDVDQMMVRKALRASASWPTAQLEDGSNHFYWQPEMFMYNDKRTGREVWKMSDTPGEPNYYHNDINLNPWSADGRRLSFTSVRPTNAFNNYDSWAQSYQPIRMIVDTNGQFLHPAANSPRRETGSYPLFWSQQIRDVFYEMGDNLYMGSTGQPGTFYKVTVTNTDVVGSPLITNFPMIGPGIYLDVVSLSPDGKRAMVRDRAGTMARLFPATIFPDSSARIDIPNGYPYFRSAQMAEFLDTPSSYTYAHADTYRLLGPGGDWFFTIPSGSNCHWRFETVGSDPNDHGPVYTNGTGEIVPEFGCTPNTFNAPYMSHLAFDNWGRNTVFSNGDSNPIGPGTWDDTNHTWVVETFGGDAQHNDWHGFTDWTATSRGSGFDGGCLASGHPRDELYTNDRVYTQKYDTSGSQVTVCYTHTLFNNGGCYNGADHEYLSVTRPSQSPDGTKIAFHSTFLNPKTGDYDDKPDIFWSVAMYPFPPTNLEAASNNGVEIRWLPPKYTNRPWTNGEELFAREIKQYHLWRSTVATGGWNEVGTGIPAFYNNDPQTNTLKPVPAPNTFSWVSAGNKIRVTDAPGTGTWYYAFTAEEWSGLESRELSEIIEVVMNGNSVSSSRIVQAKGQTHFWTTLPHAPGLTISPGQGAGQFRLSWTELGDSKVRYYNIYFSPLSNPQAVQTFRIASLPIGTNTYLDWLAPSGGFYGLTAVDRYGNESRIMYVGGNQAPRVNAGPDQTIILPVDSVQLSGQVIDEGTTTVNWNVLTGPAGAIISDSSSPVTTARFPGSGVYVLRLSAGDGEFSSYDDIQITVRATGSGNSSESLDRNVIHPAIGSEASIGFNLDGPRHVVIKVFDRKGLVRELSNQDFPAGTNSVVWDGKNSRGEKVASGIYTVLIETGGKKPLKKKIAVVR